MSTLDTYIYIEEGKKALKKQFKERHDYHIERIHKAQEHNFQGQNGFVIRFHHNRLSNEINQVLRVGKIKDAFHKNLEKLQTNHPKSWRSIG